MLVVMHREIDDESEPALTVRYQDLMFREGLVLTWYSIDRS